MKYTTNYNLKKPDQDDFYNIEDLNSNAEVIDTELKRIDEKGNAVEQNAKAYTDQQITLVTETGIPKLNVYEYKFNNVAIGTTEIQIPLETFDKQTDTIKVYINAVQRDTDYFTVVDTTRDEVGNLLEKGKILLNQSLEKESKVVIEVWKNIPMGEDGSVSGNVIAVDSIPPDRVQGLLDLKNDAVRKTGDTMTGNLRFLAGNRMQMFGNNDRFMEFLDTDNNDMREGYIGRIRSGSTRDIRIQNTISDKGLRLRDDGLLLYNNDRIWHAGNHGAGSGLDADMLDGKNANEFWEKSNLPIATTAEAQAGTRNDRIMTPLRTKEAITQGGSGFSRIATGTYTGTGGTRHIAVGFTPKIVFIDSTSTTYQHIITQLAVAHYGKSGGHNDSPQAKIATNGFDVYGVTGAGLNYYTNVEGHRYYWVAIG